MSKTSIGQINTTQTFQNWLDKTNDIVTLLETDVMTASALGDTTSGNATLVGTFTANTVIGFDDVKTDVLTSKTLAGAIGITSRISVSSSGSNSILINDAAVNGPRISYSAGGVIWNTGFNSVGSDSDDNYFTINTGSGISKFTLSPAGNMAITGKIEASNGLIGDVYASNGTTKIVENGNGTTVPATFTGNLTGNLTGDVYASNGTTKIVENGNGTTAATFTGNLIGDVYASNGTTKIIETGNGTTVPATFTGTVSSLSNHDTSDLAEGTRLYFTNARARAAVTGGTGVTVNATSGVISIGQSVSTSADVGFRSVTATGNITAYGTVSDITMKENITPIDNALEKVSKLGGYFFNYKGDDTRMTGVMAQELMDVLPGVVYEVEDPRTKETVYAVRHGNIIGLLIEAIKELQQKVGK